MEFFRPIPKEKGLKGAVGAESEAVIAAALIQAGYTVLTDTCIAMILLLRMPRDDFGKYSARQHGFQKIKPHFDLAVVASCIRGKRAEKRQ